MDKNNTSEPTIDRRTLLRNFLIISAGIVFLPGCMENEGKASIVLKNISLYAADEQELAALCETLLPKTDTPGATELGLHLFVMKMMDDAYLKPDHDKLLQGKKDWEATVKEKFGNSFIKLQSAQQQEAVRAAEADKTKSTDAAFFYNTAKKLAVQGFTTSRYYLTQVHKYELVPGRFHGCMPVTSSSTKIKPV